MNHNEKSQITEGLDYIFYMFTDVRTSAAELLIASSGAEQEIPALMSARKGLSSKK